MNIVDRIGQDMVAENPVLNQWFDIISHTYIQGDERSHRCLAKALEDCPERWLPLLNVPYGNLQLTALFEVARVREDQEGAKITSVLLNYGASLDCLNALGQTALFTAIARNKPETCKVMLQGKVNVGVVDQFGLTALEYARQLQRTGIAAMIYEGVQSGIAKNIVTGDVLDVDQEKEEQSGKVSVQKEIKQQSYMFSKIRSNAGGKIQSVTAEEHYILEQQLPPDSIYKRFIGGQSAEREFINSDPLPLGQNWTMVALKIIDKLIASSGSFWFRNSAPREEGREGIDLSVIRAKVEHHCYLSTDELTADVKSIWVLAQKRHGNSSDLTKDALKLLKRYNKKADVYGLMNLESSIVKKE